MPGYNHYPWCTCGWCSGGGGGGWNSSLRHYVEPSLLDRLLDPEREATTYPIPCWWCGEPVFYHTNGNGDCVLFDSLGYPWPVHPCWAEYARGLRSRSNISYKPERRQYPPQASKYYINNPDLIKDDIGYQVFLGYGRYFRGVTVTKYAIFGCKFKDNIIFELLKTIPQQNIVLYQDGEISVKRPAAFDLHSRLEKLSNSEKYNVIVEAISGLSGVTQGKYAIYGLKEDILAKSMGLPIDLLKRYFDKLFEFYPSGKIVITPIKTNHSITTQHQFRKKKKNQNHEIVKQDKINKNTSSIFKCPYCKKYISSDAIGIYRHIDKVHPGKKYRYI